MHMLCVSEGERGVSVQNGTWHEFLNFICTEYKGLTR